MKNPWKVRPIVKKDKKRKKVPKNKSMFINPFKSKKAIRPVKTKNYLADQNIAFNPRPRQHHKPIPKKPNKNLSYPQARKKYGASITPFGNFDNDMHLNAFDCRPFDKTRHKVPEKYKKKKIFSFAWDKPKTFEESWQDVEKRFPDVFKGSGEERYSELYKRYLLKREQHQEEFEEKYGKNPLMDIVGTYNIEVENTPENTLLFLHYIQNYLQRENPYDEYEIDIENPTKIKRITRDPKKYIKKVAGELYRTHPSQLQRDELERVREEAERRAVQNPVEETTRLATLLKNAPKSVRDHMAHLSPNQNFKMVITDAPEELLAKSTGWGGPGSCETLVSGGSELGCFSDVEWNNGIVWFYSERKTPGKDNPSGRILLRWGINERDGKPDIIIENCVYGYRGTNMEVALRYALQQWLKKRGYARGTTKAPYRYEGYSDLGTAQDGRIRSKAFSKEWKIKPTKDIHQIKKKYLKGLRQEEKPEYWKRIPEGVQTEFAGETDPDILRELAQQRGLSRVSMKRILKRAKEQKSESLVEKAIRNPTLKGGALDITQDFVLENPRYMSDFLRVHSKKLPLEKLRQFLSKPASKQYENTYVTIAGREGLTEKEVDRLINIAITIESIDTLRQLENYYRVSDKIAEKLIKSDSPLRRNIFQFIPYNTNTAKKLISNLASAHMSSNQIAAEIINVAISQRENPKNLTDLITLSPLDWREKLDLFFKKAKISDPSLVFEFLSSLVGDFTNKKYEIMQYLVEYEYDRTAIPFINSFLKSATDANILYVLSESKNLELHQYEMIMNAVERKIKKQGKVTSDVEPILKELASNKSFGVSIDEISKIIGSEKEFEEFFINLSMPKQKYMVALLKFGESIENVVGIINGLR